MTAPDTQSGGQGEFEFAAFGGGGSAASGQSIDIVRFVISIWKPLALGLSAGIVAGVALYLFLGPVYSASTQVLVSKKATVPIDDREANRYGDRGDHIELMQTDLIVERAFKDHGLDKIPALANSIDPLKEVTERLTVRRSAGQENSFDNVLTLTYLHPDMQVARAVVQAMVDSYRDYLDDTRSDNAKEIFQTLLDQQNEVEAEVARLEKEYQEFWHKAPVLLETAPVVSANGMSARGQNQYEVELATIESALNENLRKRSSIEARLATLDRKIADGASREVLEFWVLHSLSTGTSGAGGGTGSGGGAGPAITGPPEKAQLDQQLLTAHLLEQRLLHTLGKDHSQVRNVRSQIDAIIDFYRRQGLTPPNLGESSGGALSARSAALGMDLVSVYRQTLHGQLNELAIDNQNLAKLHESAEAKAKEAAVFEVEDQHRKDQIALKKAQLERLFDQIARYDIARGQEGYRLQQISQVRIERSLKQIIKIVGACGILGLGLVFCLAYAREWFDTSLKSLDEVRANIGAPLMGLVPRFASTEDGDRLARERGLEPALCYFHRPGSREAEAIRSIRTTLFVSLESDETVIQVSSPEPGDGKSTSAANLAIAMAQSGKSVLLIDGDLRRPTQHALFHLSQELGLSDVLQGEVDWENAIKSTPVDGLRVMTAGRSPDSPAELLATPALARVLGYARADFDYVLIDSPPILAVSDPCILARETDGMLTVVRMQKTKRAAVSRMKETLHAHGVKVFGVLANDFQNARAEETGYETYGNYYATERTVPDLGEQQANKTEMSQPVKL